ncbi:unnamed protein product [Heterobilharzia americana]|nr:unnamed protein product [Heterobilharzia americana]
MEALLAYVDIPQDCHEAIPLLNLENPVFARLLKRMLKKLEKGETCTRKQLPLLSSDGAEEDSDFLLIGTNQEEKSNMLFARLPDSTGGNEVYKLPFVRFSIRRINGLEKAQEDHNDKTNHFPPADLEPQLLDSLKRLDDKIDNFGSQLTKLLERLLQSPKASRPRQRKPAASVTNTTTTTTAAAAVGTTSDTQKSAHTSESTSAPKPTSTSKPTPVPKSTSAPKPALKSTPTKSLITPVSGTPSNYTKNESKANIEKKSTHSSPPNHSSEDVVPTFNSSVDNTIDHVLARINKMKDISLESMPQNSQISVNGKEVPSDNSVDTDAFDRHIVVEEYRNPVIVPQRNVVAISPCVSFTVKPVQSSASSSKRKYQPMECCDEVMPKNVSHEEYSLIDIQSSGEKKKHKHKRRKHTPEEA